MGEMGLVWSVDHGQLWNQRWNTAWTTSFHTLLTRERNLAVHIYTKLSLLHSVY